MIFGFLRQNLKAQAVAVPFSMAWLGAGLEPEPDDGRTRACERLGSFRRELHGCFTARGDELFELADAVLCAEGPVRTLVGLSLAPEHRRGHGALYDAVNAGRVDVARLRWSLACLPLPRWPDGRIRLAVDVSNWLRPGAATSPGRVFCPGYARGKGQAQMIPGRPYSVGAPPEPGRTSWTPTPDAGRPRPAVTTTTETTRYGTAVASSWNRLHPRLTGRGAWADHDGELPVIEGTLIRLQVDHLPGDRNPKPVWLWSSHTGADTAHVDLLWQAFLRRFDLEHTFRLFKQVLGWTAPAIRDPAAADRWTWLIIAAHSQLRLARNLSADLRRPWEKPPPPGPLTPGPAPGKATAPRPMSSHPPHGHGAPGSGQITSPQLRPPAAAAHKTRCARNPGCSRQRLE